MWKTLYYGKHLAIEYYKVPENIQKYWENTLVEKNITYMRGGVGSKKRKVEFQNIITQHLPSIDPLPKSTIASIDRALLKAWVCAGIPFEVIENPFMLDLFKQLNPAYILPTRTSLSETLLDQEEARVNKKVHEELYNIDNLTLCMYNFCLN